MNLVDSLYCGFYTGFVCELIKVGARCSSLVVCSLADWRDVKLLTLAVLLDEYAFLMISRSFL